jgi:hypothetical protein
MKHAQLSRQRTIAFFGKSETQGCRQRIQGLRPLPVEVPHAEVDADEDYRDGAENN